MKKLEAQLQKQGDDFLALDGWRAIVTDPPHMRGLGVTEKGIPDRLYLRYGQKANRSFPQGDEDQILWIEWKKKGGKAAQHQRDWHTLERSKGALVWLAGIDFPATIEGFQAHYIASGLNRRIAQPMLRVPLGMRASKSTTAEEG